MKTIKLKVGFDYMEFYVMPRDKWNLMCDKIDARMKPKLKELRKNRRLAEQEMKNKIINC